MNCNIKEVIKKHGIIIQKIWKQLKFTIIKTYPRKIASINDIIHNLWKQYFKVTFSFVLIRTQIKRNICKDIVSNFITY